VDEGLEVNTDWGRKSWKELVAHYQHSWIETVLFRGNTTIMVHADVGRHHKMVLNVTIPGLARTCLFSALSA
jgi:hypothetical protein